MLEKVNEVLEVRPLSSSLFVPPSNMLMLVFSTCRLSHSANSIMSVLRFGDDVHLRQVFSRDGAGARTPDLSGVA
jgi:hypothetical protein